MNISKMNNRHIVHSVCFVIINIAIMFFCCGIYLCDPAFFNPGRIIGIYMIMTAVHICISLIAYLGYDYV